MSTTEFFYTDVDLSGNTLSNSEITNSKVSLEIVESLPTLGTDGVWQLGRSVIFDGKLYTWTMTSAGGETLPSIPTLDPDLYVVGAGGTDNLVGEGAWYYDEGNTGVSYRTASGDIAYFNAWWDAVGVDTTELASTINNNIEALQNDVLGINGNVSELQTGLAANSNAITTANSAINTEKGRIDAILSAADADKDSFAEVVTLINQIDTENDDALVGYKQSMKDKNTFNTFLSNGPLLPYTQELTVDYNNAAFGINQSINFFLSAVAKILFQALYTPPTEWDIYTQEDGKIYYNESRFMFNNDPADPLQNFLAANGGENRATALQRLALSGSETLVEDIVALILNGYKLNIEFEDDNGSNLRIPYKRVPTSITSDVIWSDARDEKIRVALQGMSFDWKEVSLLGKGIDLTKQINIKLSISPTYDNPFQKLSLMFIF